MKKLKSRMISLLFVLAVVIGMFPVTAFAAGGDVTVKVGGVALTVNSGGAAYAKTDTSGNVNTAGATQDDYNIKFEIVDNAPTLTLKDATINNTNGDGIYAQGYNLTIVGVDTEKEGANNISGSKSAIKVCGNITIKGKLGAINSGSDSAIYTIPSTAFPQATGNIYIAEDAVVGDVSSTGWRAIESGFGSITIDGEVGDVSGLIGIHSNPAYEHDIAINGKVGNISGSEYGIFAQNTLNISDGAEVGDISGALGGIMTISDANISGNVKKVSGQVGIRSLMGDIALSGNVGTIIGNGGANQMSASYGVRADAGKISISDVVGPIRASSKGENVTVLAVFAKTGIEFTNSVAIKTPVNSKVGTLGSGSYTIFDAAGATVKDLELAYMYTVTYKINGKIVATVKVEKGKDAIAPAIPEKEGYTARWDHDGKNITEDTEINAIYTANTHPETDKADGTSGQASPGTGENSNIRLWFTLAFVSGSALLVLAVWGSKKKKVNR